jgi:hypothetical protein
VHDGTRAGLVGLKSGSVSELKFAMHY